MAERGISIVMFYSFLYFGLRKYKKMFILYIYGPLIIKSSDFECAQLFVCVGSCAFVNAYGVL